MLCAGARGAFALSTPAAGGRGLRIAELIQREVAQALPGLKDPRIRGLLTVNAVELSRDKSIARLYYSVLGAPEDDDLDAGLAHAAVWLRRALGRSLRLKRVPELRFVRAPAGRLMPDAETLPQSEHEPDPDSDAGRDPEPES